MGGWKAVSTTVLWLLCVLLVPQVARSQPTIWDVSVIEVSATSVVVYWRTDTPSDSRVNYGTTTPPSKTKYNSTRVTHHSIRLEGLTPDTLYYFEVQSTDDSGTRTDNRAGEYYSFTTLAGENAISLEPAFGVYNDGITVTVTVQKEGTYHVCWSSASEQNRLKTFKSTKSESFTFNFRVPEAPRGIHKVYLTNASYSVLASANFEVHPTVGIKPKKGPVGMEVAIRGYGFETNEKDIEISFRERVIMEALQADNIGSWLVFYTIPPAPSGHYCFEVRAEQAAEECEYWTECIDVTPQLVLSADWGTVNKTIAVRGTGFAANEGEILVTFDGEVIKRDIFADKDGSWRATFVIPPCESGRHFVDAFGMSTKAQDVPDVAIVVYTGVSVSPGVAFVGDKIEVVGGGFVPGERGIKVTLDGTVVAENIVADGEGGWEASFDLPPVSYGSHTVCAYGDITKAADVTTDVLLVGAKISLSPESGQVGASVTIRGNGFNSAQLVTVKFDGTNVLEGVATDPKGNVIATFRVPPSSPGQHTVTVTDPGGAASSAVFTVELVPVGTPQLILPLGGSKVSSGDVTFQWQTVSGVSPIAYTLEVSNTPDFGVLLRSKSNLPGATYKLTADEALPKGTYYWRVKAIDAVGTQSQWSITSSFTVAPPRSKTWIWVLVGIVVVAAITYIAYRATRFRIRE